LTYPNLFDIFKTMGTVYLLGEFCDSGRFKIGITKNSVKKRIKELQTS